jgi:hypothetical protein
MLQPTLPQLDATLVRHMLAHEADASFSWEAQLRLHQA